jgi:hypothetical protein
MLTKLKILNFANGIPLLLGLLMVASVPGFGQRGSNETIDATAFGTSTQLGRSVGRIQIPGTVGFDLSFIREVLTPTGRTIRFVTNRKIAFGEAYWDTQSKSFNLTAGEINLNDNDKSKSDGALFPAAQLIVNKEGELQFELNQNAWETD